MTSATIDASRFNHAAKVNTAAQAIIDKVLNTSTNQEIFEQEELIAKMLTNLVIDVLNSVADQVVPEGKNPDPEEWPGQMYWLGGQDTVRQRLLSVARELADA